jgi:Flp pilus assembly protein TadB
VTAVALLAGVAVVAGVLLAVSGVRLAPIVERARPRRRRRPVPGPERIVLVGAVALAVLVLTRWPVAAIAAGAAAGLLSGPASPLRRHSESAEIAEALTVWAEMLRDATGTPRGIEGVLVATAAGAPLAIRPHVLRLAQRLPYDPLGPALDDLADDLAHPVGDLVVTALGLAARSGGRQIRTVLDDLASVAREEARMHRRIEVARARPRADMRSVLVIMGLFIAVFSVVGRDYLAPYSSPGGQLVLVLVVGIWATAVWAMSRMGRSEEIERFLVRSDHEGAAT